MNRPESPQTAFPIPDVQSRPDARRTAIDQVGIRGLRYPLLFADSDGVARPTIASYNVYVALAAERKGTEILNRIKRHGVTMLCGAQTVLAAVLDA